MKKKNSSSCKMMSIVEPFREFRNRSENRPNVTSTRDIYAGSLLAPARRPLTLCAAATISPPPTRRAASTAQSTRLLRCSALVRVPQCVFFKGTVVGCLLPSCQDETGLDAHSRSCHTTSLSCVRVHVVLLLWHERGAGISHLMRLAFESLSH